MSVSKRFSGFLNNITLTQAQRDSGRSRRESVVQLLNSQYWGSQHKTNNSLFVGSWGKHTTVRPPRDVDVLFELPSSVYDRFALRSGNRQSQLLQEVKGVLASKFTNTNIKGDGPVVKVPFASYDVELIPAFALTTGRYWICMTDNGGYYKEADYDAEVEAVKDSNDLTDGKTRHLIRMMKRWQANCNVPLKSFWLELLSIEFLRRWKHKDESMLYYDWMVRDFLRDIEGKSHHILYAPGTYEAMNIGEGWLSKARTARQRAEKACDNESNSPEVAGEEWQKIFGTDIPKNP